VATHEQGAGNLEKEQGSVVNMQWTGFLIEFLVAKRREKGLIWGLIGRG